LDCGGGGFVGVVVVADMGVGRVQESVWGSQDPGSSHDVRTEMASKTLASVGLFGSSSHTL
jgi:hypothetical protein